jgi:prolipoprotein diacylglyceryltransferase
MVLGGIERFLVEFVRSKDDRVLGAFTIAQAASIVMILVGVALLSAWRRPSSDEQRLPASLRPKQVPVAAGG